MRMTNVKSSKGVDVESAMSYTSNFELKDDKLKAYFDKRIQQNQREFER